MHSATCYFPMAAYKAYYKLQEHNANLSSTADNEDKREQVAH